jgi:hypothetical protein
MGSIAPFNTTTNLYNTAQASSTTGTPGDSSATTRPQDTSAKSAALLKDDTDTVKLSTTAQAKLLHAEGQSVNTIAASLGTSAKAINDILGITLEKAIEKTLQETQAN